MKNNKSKFSKRVLTVVLSLVMAIALLPATAVAAVDGPVTVQNTGFVTCLGALTVSNVLILILSAAAITCLVVMYVMRYNKSRWYE